MLGMGWVEIFLIVIVALVVIGPDKLPEAARGLAKGLRQVQRFVSDVRDTVNLDEFDQQVRNEVDRSFVAPKPQVSNLKDGDEPHPDFVGYDNNIDDYDEDEDPYDPVTPSAKSKKKESGDHKT
ncbi:MAG: twin-arginine translocase subunit TatB [Magnetococcales bacterium]|nr:twin-arginine translocase subunit TatB [Magnetococcales bacterium]